jgi:hypothetical protein
MTEQGAWGTFADPLYEQAVALVRKHKRGSISLVQRHLAIGWNRAHGLIDAMVGTVLTDMPPIGKIIPPGVALPAAPQPAGWHISFDGGTTWEYRSENPEGKIGDCFAVIRPLVYGDGNDWRADGVPEGVHAQPPNIHLLWRDACEEWGEAVGGPAEYEIFAQKLLSAYGVRVGDGKGHEPAHVGGGKQ